MDQDTGAPDRFDSLGDFYGPEVTAHSDPLMNALLKWDHDDYRPLQESDPELYRLICDQIGLELDIIVGEGSVKLGLNQRHVVVTWNGDDEDLFDVVLEGARLLTDQPS